MSTAIAALHPSIRPLNLLRTLSVACLLVVGLSACGDKGAGSPVASSNEAGGEGSNGAGNGQAASPPAASARVEGVPQSGSAQAEPLPSFTPTADEVRMAMQQILVQKAMTLAPSPQRDEWYAAESARFAAIKVGNCTTAPLGTPSVCHIAVGDKTAQVEILLTRGGWVIVK